MKILNYSDIFKTKFDGYLDVCRKAYVETIDSLKGRKIYKYILFLELIL